MRIVITLLFFIATVVWAVEPKIQSKDPGKDSQAAAEKTTTPEDEEPEEDKIVNLESEDAFIDLSDALKSKHFVRRAILNTAIKNSSRFHLGRPYVNHLVGFNAIVQMAPATKTITAMQSLGGGYVFSFGLGVEAGLEFSALSDFYVGTRYYFDQLSAFVWPFLGLGAVSQVSILSVSDPTRSLANYYGPSNGFYANFGLMIPLVDIGLKAEMRANVYGAERIVVTTGVGAVLFL